MQNIKKRALSPFLFVFSVVAAVSHAALSSSSASAVEGRRLGELGGRRRRGGVFSAPLILLFVLGGRRLDFDEDGIYADLRDVFEFDEEVRLSPAESLAARNDDSLHLPVGKAEDDVADSSELFAVADIDHLLLL